MITTNRLTTILFIIYLIVLFWIIVFKLNVSFSYTGDRSINLIPYCKPSIVNGKIDFSEMVLNVLIFVPLGVYTGVLFKRGSVEKKLLFISFTSLIIEGLQFGFALGAFDITDIINNTLGGIIGLLIVKGIEKIYGDREKTQKFINIIATIGTAIVVLFLLLLKTNNLWIRYQ